MDRNAEKPSQAEGEDPDRPADASVEPIDGHPSQAEGEDPDRPAESEGEDVTSADYDD
ncbi:hypothetical protein ACPW96_00785 [Micromonospora sp. DT81.3]|uniref:hypothetical protein n=1 Tax=Actinomycetes TaxID=1760 RepID=UPI003CFB1835